MIVQFGNHNLPHLTGAAVSYTVDDLDQQILRIDVEIPVFTFVRNRTQLAAAVFVVDLTAENLLQVAAMHRR